MSRFNKKDESRLNVSNLFNENEDGAPVVSGISTFSSPNYFVPPSGSTAQRPQNPGEGMIRFNTDSGHLEYYTGTHWADVITNDNELGDHNLAADKSGRGTGTRGLLATGFTGSRSDAIEYITFSTLGDGVDFGNLTVDRSGVRAAASNIRALFMGGMGPNASAADTNIIDFVSIPSTGNATDFGDLLHAQRDGVAFSNQTRALFSGGQGNSNNVINAIEIAQTGTKEDFGDLISGLGGMAGCSNAVRGIFAGGTNPVSNVISYVTISSYGNAQDFGDLIEANESLNGSSNSIRGVFGAGNAPSRTNRIQFITIPTTGNAQDFGDLTTARNTPSAAASSTRAIFAAGNGPGSPGALDVIDYVEIMTTGNALDFGDTNVAGWTGDGTSNGHGGL